VSETELSVVCKSCGSEVSPYVTECPYCGARLRKRAPKLERHGDALEARRRPSGLGLGRRLRAALPDDSRPYATVAVILASAALLVVRTAIAEPLSSVGALIVPFEDAWWRLLTTPFAYSDVGYLFVVGLALAIFATGLERRLGSVPTLVLLLACGSLGALGGAGVANAIGDDVVTIAGGNGMAIGALAAWFAIRRAEARRAIDEEYDPIGVTIAAAVLLALPIVEGSADVFAGLAGGAVGALAGFAASSLRPGRQ